MQRRASAEMGLSSGVCFPSTGYSYENDSEDSDFKRCLHPNDAILDIAEMVPSASPAARQRHSPSLATLGSPRRSIDGSAPV